MVYELPWLHKTSIGRHIEWSTGDKMVYGLLWLDKRALALIKRPLGAIKWFTGDKVVYGCLRLDRTAIGAIKRSTGDKIVYGPPIKLFLALIKRPSRAMK